MENKVHKASDRILISSKQLRIPVSGIVAESMFGQHESTISIKCKDGLLSFNNYPKTLNVDSNDWETEKTFEDLKRLYLFLRTIPNQPLSVSFTAHSVFIEVNGILV